MIETMQCYTSKHIAVVIPTKDRPKSICDLLRSLVDQSSRPGRVIIVDSGEELGSVLDEFTGVLPIEYYRSTPSQILQRNFGLSLLNSSTPLVATIDDDIVFEPNSFAEVLDVVNSYGANLAGVGFNCRSSVEQDSSFINRLFFMSSKEQGVITSSGYNTSIAEVNENIHTSWLGGGYTVWNLSILKKFKQVNIKTRWAVGEDVRLSYKIGKEYPLIVASKAFCQEKQIPIGSMPRSSESYYKGVKAAAAFYYFVKTNPELSRLACIWMLFGRSIGSMLIGIRNLNKSNINYAFGHFAVLLLIPADFLKILNIKQLMEDNDYY